VGVSAFKVDLFSILMTQYIFFLVVSDNFVLPTVLAHLGALPENKDYSIQMSSTSQTAII